MIHTGYPLPAPFNHASADARARARRAAFLTSHDLRVIDQTDANIVRFCRVLQEDWIAGRVRPRFTSAKQAIPALARIATRYGPSGSTTELGREFLPGLTIYSRRNTSRPCLVTCHCDVLNPAEIGELDEFRAAGADVQVAGESWVARVGVRVLIANPADLTLTPYPEPDPELRPGRSFQPRHVRLRSPLTADTVRTPEPESTGEDR